MTERSMDISAENKIDLRFLHGLACKGNLAVFQWCMDMKLMSDHYICPKCNRIMKLVERKDVNDGYVWSCRMWGDNKHYITRSLRRNTFFKNGHVSVFHSLIIAYLWLKKVKPTFINEELTVTLRTALDWLHFLRELCVEICISESTVVGGDGIKVEIEAKPFFEIKNLKGRRAQGKWIIFGVEENSSKFFFRTIESNHKAVLLHTIKEWVLPGSVIISNCLKNHNLKYDVQFKELSEEYNMSFQCPDSNTNMLKNIFETVKNLIRTTYSDEAFNHYLAEYLWRRAHNNNARSLVNSFFKAIAEIFPPENADS